jgi:hypothetical protein
LSLALLSTPFVCMDSKDRDKLIIIVMAIHFNGRYIEVTSSVSVVRNNAPVWAIATPPMLLRIVNPEAVINYFEFFFLSYPKM